MKTITLIKQHSNVQVGHLYEHLFLRRINEFFYDNGMYKSIDYYTHGTTFDAGGIIHIEIGLMSYAAKELSDEIAELSINLGENNINVTLGLQQIIAEEPYQLVIQNIDKIVEDLRKLDTQSWQPLGNTDALDTSRVRRSSKPLYLSNREQPNPKKALFVITASSRVDPRLRPLFNEVGRVLLLTLSNRVTAGYGFYAGELYGNAKPLSVTSELLIAPALYIDLDLDGIVDLTKSTLGKILASDFPERLCSSILAIAPDEVRILNETLILTGSKGWQEIATADNIKKVINTLQLSVSTGRRKVSLINLTF